MDHDQLLLQVTQHLYRKRRAGIGFEAGQNFTMSEQAYIWANGFEGFDQTFRHFNLVIRRLLPICLLAVLTHRKHFVAELQRCWRQIVLAEMGALVFRCSDERTLLKPREISFRIVTQSCYTTKNHRVLRP